MGCAGQGDARASGLSSSRHVAIGWRMRDSECQRRVGRPPLMLNSARTAAPNRSLSYNLCVAGQLYINEGRGESLPRSLVWMGSRGRRAAKDGLEARVRCAQGG